jgi:hypothetical protein
VNEELKSIWRETGRVSRAFLVWLALVLSVVFAMLFLGPMATAPSEPPGPLAIFIVGVSGASLLLCLWLFVRWSTCCWRNLRRTLMGLAVLATLIACFYTEENWRGKRAWDICKRELQAKGAALDWNAYIPAPVPDERNIFKAPKMQEWFVRSGSNELSQRLNRCSPGFFLLPNTNASPVMVAELTVAPDKASLDPGKADAVLRFDDPAARAQAKKLIDDAVGPAASGSQDYTFITRPLNQIKAVHILMLADKVPTTTEVAELFPLDTIAPAAPWAPVDLNRLRVESAGSNSFRVVLNRSQFWFCTAADYLELSDQFETDFDLIREALKRPYARMGGEYEQPVAMPIPDFVCIRSLAQTLAQRAQCLLLLGQPERALRELALCHDLSRLLEARPTAKPMSLVAAMINVAVTGLYLDTVADGMRLQAWQGPQLSQLQKQIEEINLPQYVAQAFQSETAGLCRALETMEIKTFLSFGPPTANLWQKIRNPESLLFSAIPRGWVYQNMAVVALHRQKVIGGFDPARVVVLPRLLDGVGREANIEFNHFSPYTFLAARALPNWIRAWQTLARNQTLANEALVVCALKRYRLAHGQYPETLERLVPRYVEKLPHDIIGGQPLNYRRADDGQFVLYSIGWNEKDDGGTVALTDSKPPRVNLDEGDWVWQYHAN